MSDTNTFFINPLPTRTWNHLRMNETEVAVPAGGQAVKVQTEMEGSWKETDDASLRASLAGIPTGCGSAVTEFLSAENTGVNTFEKDDRSEDVLRLGFHYQDGTQGRNFIGITAGEGALVTVVEDFTSEPRETRGDVSGQAEKEQGGSGAGENSAEAGAEVSGTAIVQTVIRAAKGSLVRLIQIHRAADGFTVINDTGADCADDARVEVIHVVEAGGTNYIGCSADLVGNRSTFAADIAYTVTGDNRLDMNYVVLQKGRKTDSRVDALGVLRDRAFKLFRGTIDFRRGSSESVGNEKENVLLMDDDVVNQTIPLILCSEEDVEGNHGATIGELDAETLFYLETRGLSREQVNEMVAKGRMDSVIRLIPDEKTKKTLLSAED
ncbi:MAG: SufB/SufD family protein [Lachnospiraceae bacterium]|jgi:Fe-S cluster assembly scaffold protein SufB